MKRSILFIGAIIVSFSVFSQENQSQKPSNIRTYTPSKLLSSGQWDIKWFNNLYTQTKSTFQKGKLPRETYFTSTIDVFTGISEQNRFNIGLLVEIRSNVIGGRDALDVFKFDGDPNTARSGITSIAPAIKFNPFKKVRNFTIQSAFHIPLVDNETENGVYLDQKGYIWQNRFFYDHSFDGDTWQLFAELNTEFNFGKGTDSFANNSLGLTPGVFISYFPSQSFTILALGQHSQRIDLGNNFAQNYTAIGGGAKFQINRVLNIEALYTNFVRGNNTGLGETFNLGLRALF